MPTYDIERYLNVRSAYGASIGPDGEVAFLMDTTGVPQVWTVDEAGGWPEQRTYHDERVTFVDWSPERREFVFGMDEGGNERAQFYLYDPDTGVETNLTRHPDAKHRWGGWDGDGDRFAFASNRRDESVFDVYLQDRDAVGDGAELVHEGDGWLSVAGWSPDDDRLLVHKAYGSFDHDLYSLELSTRDFEHLTPHEGDARFASPEWGPDGEVVYCCTDRDSDTLRLERLDPATGDWAVVEDGTGPSEVPGKAGDADRPWNVDGVTIHQDSGQVAYSRNVDGYTELTVGRFRNRTTITGKETVEVDTGVAGGVDWGPEGDHLALSGTGRTDNTNVHVASADTGASERWTAAATAGIPRETFVEPELVHYPTFDGRDIPALFSLPEGAADTDDLPVVVDVHGGPESQRRPSFAAVTQYFLNNGYAVFEPNVRGSAGYGREYASLDDVRNRLDSVRDLKHAVEWLHDHPAVADDRIAVKGGSYGGFMVLSAVTEYPELWAAGVDIVGIANFVTFLENTGDWRRELREAEYGSLDEDREFLEEISPTNNIEQIECPLIVLHGENDPRVPVGEAEQIVEEAREQGVPVEKLIFEDEGHGFTKLENRIEAYTDIVGFLDDHV